MPSVGSPGPLSGVAKWLAGVAPADEIDGFEFRSAEFGNVSILWHLRPMLRQHLSTERVDLYLPSAPHPGPFQSQVDAADPREQAAKRHAPPPRSGPQIAHPLSAAHRFPVSSA